MMKNLTLLFTGFLMACLMTSCGTTQVVTANSTPPIQASEPIPYDQLMDIGITSIWRETFYSSLNIAHSVLERLGLTDYEARTIVETFEEHDISRLKGHPKG